MIATRFGVTSMVLTMLFNTLTLGAPPPQKVLNPENASAAIAPAEQGTRTNDQPAVVSEGNAKSADYNRPSVEAARDRAKLMHDIYSATLDVMHDRYFHGDRTMVPARAMEDVFSRMQRQYKTEARWIAVNLKPMSLDHEPESEFEKRAAKQIAAGKSEVETVDDGMYRRAGAIPLSGGCISCHAGFFRTPPTKPKFAGLVISIPLTPESE